MATERLGASCRNFKILDDHVLNLETIFVQMSYGACAIRLLLTAKLPYLLCESAEAYPDGLPPG